MKIIPCAAALLATTLLAGPASAGFIDAGATLTSALDADGVNYDYTIALKNAPTSTDPIGTFWFAWVPGKDFMSNSPLSISSPAGWASKITHGPATDGYAIQWVAGSAAADVAIGGSLTFGFKSAETPAQLAGKSALYPTFAEATAVVYNAAPFSADSETFVVTPAGSVPEPSTLALSIVGGLTAVALGRARRRTRA